MDGEFNVSTDTKEKIKLDSRINSADWLSSIARGGAEAQMRVKTVFVAEGSSIEIKGRSSKGKSPGTITGKIYNNEFIGKLLIPEKVELGADIWFDAKLPKHGLKMESGTSIPAKPAIHASKICWGRQEVNRGDEVLLTCQFESGVQDGEDATIIIYEHNPNSYDFKVTSFQTTILNNKIEAKWLFDYIDDTQQIATHEELQPVGKSYVHPQYFFVVVVDGVKIGEKRESGLMKFKDALKLNVTIGADAAGGYEVTAEMSDGKQQTWTLDENGNAALGDLVPGRAIIKSVALPQSHGKSQSKSGGAASIDKQLVKAHHHVVTFPREQKEITAEVKTGECVYLQLHRTAFLLDGHMHIQSNNCCPLPLQWALKARGVYEFSRKIVEDSRKPVDRKSLSDFTTGRIGLAVVGRLGKIGRLSTDVISKVFMDQAKSQDMNKSIASVILDQEEWAKLEKNITANELLAKAAKKADLEKLSGDTLEDFTDNFSKLCEFYYKNRDVLRMNVALPMDMTFGHFWGQFGIPVYLAGNEALYYVNDFVQLNASESSLTVIKNISVDFDALVPRSGRSTMVAGSFPSPAITTDTIHVYPKMLSSDAYFGKFSLTKELRNYEAYLEAKARNQKPTELFFVHFGGDLKIARQLLQKEFVHFVAVAPAENEVRFEDYGTQYCRTQCAAIEYPLQIFPFYHFDPRRHYDPVKGTPEQIANLLCTRHAFFTASSDASENVTFSDGTVHSGAMKIEPHRQFNDAAFMASFLRNKMISLSDVYKNLFLYPQSIEGLFWGIKMYPRLGFAPDDFATFPHLKDFYRTCMDNTIPITFHCSRGGMQIPDYFNYQRYKDGPANNEYDLVKTDEQFSDHYAAPGNWERVLEKYSKLKVDMAHFGGYDEWKYCKNFEDLEKDIGSQSDKSKRYNGWIKKIAQMVDRFDNVYTDLSYFVNPAPSHFSYDCKNVAKDLSYLLMNHKGLKDRVLMGSDWYMIEQEKFKGVGAFYRKMFIMLQEVSKNVGYDAWHQFGVVNPLRYLGLIDEAKGGKGPFEIDVSKMEKFTERFDGYWKKSDWRKTANFNGNPKSIKETISVTLNQLRLNSKVLDAAEIKKNNSLLILSD